MPEEKSEDRGMRKERETKDDGRYIIFYTFEEEEAEAPPGEEGAG